MILAYPEYSVHHLAINSGWKGLENKPFFPNPLSNCGNEPFKNALSPALRLTIIAIEPISLFSTL
jgi:hypothetical protein